MMFHVKPLFAGMRSWKSFAVGVLALTAYSPALAQTSTCRVVTSCGMAVFTAGNPAPCTVDVNGNTCSNANLTNNTGTFNATAPTLADAEQHALRLDAKGRLVITQEKRDTYAAAAHELAVASGATDFFCISGSATKTIILKKVHYSAVSSNTGQYDALLAKRSSANSGGTSTVIANVPMDSTSPAGQATVTAYTVNPTSLGVLVGYIASDDYTIVSTASNLVSSIRDVSFGQEENQGVVLRGTAESVCLNFNAQSLSGMKWDIYLEWREITGG
jgi:hypothetical protein